MEIEDLSELCRLCLESSTSLIPFDTTLHFSTKSIPELIKYCVDLNCNLQDEGISPKNICQGCLDKLQLVHEFKWKSHESDKYLKQIISHSGLIPPEEPDITPYNPLNEINSSLYEHADDEDEDEDDENSLLTPMEPMDFDYTKQISNAVENGLELKKGQRHGEFHCRICNKYFKYVKPYKNHLKLHKSTPKKISYYKRKKLLLAQASEQTLSPPKSAPLKIVKTLSRRSEPQAKYDSLSPYNSPAPYEKESNALHTNRDSSPDFGDFMLQTSRHLLNGDDYAEEQQAGTSNHRPKGRTWKKDDADDVDYNPNARKTRTVKPSILKKPSSLVAAEAIIPDIVTPPLEKRRVRFPAKSTKEVDEDEPPPKRPGPLSKTRLKAKTTEEKVMIEGFSEVDITKMLKKPRRDDSSKYVDDSGSQSQSSNRSRSRSASVELIPEVDIFGRG
ncbi:unnamed protein product [Chironomus riparius]|uniref:ZAD domain-containing protein n=1 Tax=Chironomus riparius TaxID=315576 RepID=A0A9N9WNN9_9DIPT|nr:unnamed protein product [Chironomus riparius]